MAKEPISEFWPWYRDIDQDWVLDVFDLALGFYKGRYPNRPLALALKFASKARTRSEHEQESDRGICQNSPMHEDLVVMVDALRKAGGL
jgi:hypothetical protein